MLIQIRRGLYIPGANLPMRGPEPFLLANHLYGPSYVSMESALSYWGLIPEKVFETSCITTRATKSFKTAMGKFSYTKLPLPYYSYGIQQVLLTPRQTVLLAGPEKALCDKIITTPGLQLRSRIQTIEFLTEDLRIEKEALRKLNGKDLRVWAKTSTKKSSILLLAQTIESL